MKLKVLLMTCLFIFGFGKVSFAQSFARCTYPAPACLLDASYFLNGEYFPYSSIGGEGEARTTKNILPPIFTREYAGIFKEFSGCNEGIICGGLWKIKPDYRMKPLFSKKDGERVIEPLIKYGGGKSKYLDRSVYPCLDDIRVKDDYGRETSYCRVGELPTNLTDKEPQPSQKWNYVTNEWYFDDENNLFDDYGLPTALEKTLKKMAERLDMQEFGDITIADTADIPLSDFDLVGNKYKYKLPVGVIVDHVAFFSNGAERWLIPLKLTFKNNKYMISFNKKVFDKLADAKAAASTRSLRFDTGDCFVRWYTYSE